MFWQLALGWPLGCPNDYLATQCSQQAMTVRDGQPWRLEARRREGRRVTNNSTRMNCQVLQVVRRQHLRVP